MRRIYLDNNATSRPSAAVLEAAGRALPAEWGNPSGGHAVAKSARAAVEAARKQVATVLWADPREIAFTSGGTESNITALLAALAVHPDRKHIITTEVEHPSILRTCERLRLQGVEITLLPVDSNGIVSLVDLERAIRNDTALVSMMWANNETGVIFPIQPAARLCRRHGVLFHTDAVQALGKVETNVQKAAPDFMSVSGHKICGLKGSGALYVKRHLRFQALFVGGHQESDRRAGTENVPGIISLGVAAENIIAPDPSLRDRLEQELLEISGTRVIGAQSARIPNTTNICFRGVDGQQLLEELDRRGICASRGSACETGFHRPSHVLTAMGLSRDDERSCIRFSLACDQKLQEVCEAVAIVRDCVRLVKS